MVPVAFMLGAAVAGAVLRAARRASAARPGALRWFAGLLPALLQAAYFGALAVTGGVHYTAHLWIGLVVFAGVIGWLLSYLVLPPRGAVERAATG